ncbi:LSM domain-containing protein [Rhizoctonia solani AG-1 IA]|uniref:Small nuclear ribonucleoprotein Sm D3 n=1 Tax=Thanatephorus cucumeris (strain AG1-IA) TaxID=983506 RepID=L8WN64_THACA|nr:LSM domain-containing protein [Rhizoctonia solani AG-1 IA]
MASTIGVPVKLLHEALGHIITVELKSGALYPEDSLNISLKDITVTGRDGKVSQLDQVYIRGSMVRFFIVPDMLQNAPIWPECHEGKGYRNSSWSCYHHARPLPMHLSYMSHSHVPSSARRGRGIPQSRGIRR